MSLLYLLSCTSTWESQVSRELARQWEGPTQVVQFPERVPGYTLFAVVQSDEKGQWRHYAPGLLDGAQHAITDLALARALVMQAVPSGEAVAAAQAINRLRPSLQEERKVFDKPQELRESWRHLQAPTMDSANTTLVYWSAMDPYEEVTVTRSGQSAMLISK
ncbi:MAG: hypothetical protein ACI9VR_004134 [Cognaticolwellia sp.]|jgi:hypothetical protein